MLVATPAYNGIQPTRQLSTSWPRIQRVIPSVVAAIDAAVPGSYTEVEIRGFGRGRAHIGGLQVHELCGGLPDSMNALPNKPLQLAAGAFAGLGLWVNLIGTRRGQTWALDALMSRSSVKEEAMPTTAA